MSSPRDRDGFDDRAEEGAGWREPAHLGEGAPAPADREASGPVEPAGGDRPEELSGYGAQQRGAGGPDWLGRGAGRRRGVVGEVFTYQGDVFGAQSWALAHGWTISDGSGPEDAVLSDLIASAPVRPTKDHRAAGVLRGRAGSLELVAFDVVYPTGRSLVPQWAVTAAPMLAAVPPFRLSPARFWRHRTGGLLPMPSGNEQFDTRWLLLAGEDSPQLRALVQDPTVQGLLLGSDDGDEFWSMPGRGAGGTGGFVAAIRPDGHRPLLIEHQARLLTAIVGALTAAW